MLKTKYLVAILQALQKKKNTVYITIHAAQEYMKLSWMVKWKTLTETNPFPSVNFSR